MVEQIEIVGGSTMRIGNVKELLGKLLPKKREER